MKSSSLLLGLVIGLVLGFLLTKISNAKSIATLSKTDTSQTAIPVGWKWADSLDAVKAAPHNHKVLFENNQVRILEVTLDPYEFENLHTHALPSVMFGAGNDTSEFDIIYYPYGYDSLKHEYFAKDSIRQHHTGRANKPNEGNFMKPEGPHRIKNLSKKRIDVFRVEFKAVSTSMSLRRDQLTAQLFSVNLQDTLLPELLSQKKYFRFHADLPA